MKKRAIPQPRTDADPALKAVVENIQVIMGQRGQRIAPLQATATQADIIAKLNEVIDVLQ